VDERIDAMIDRAVKRLVQSKAMKQMLASTSPQGRDDQPPKKIRTAIKGASASIHPEWDSGGKVAEAGARQLSNEREEPKRVLPTGLKRNSATDSGSFAKKEVYRLI